jgi:hypothetical protein
MSDILFQRVFAGSAYSSILQIVDEMDGYITNVQNMMGGKFAEIWQTDS